MRKHVKKPDHIRQQDWDAVDSPPLTDEELAAMRPAKDVLPEAVYNSLRRKRGERTPQKASTKMAIKLRIDPDVVAAYKAKGKDWQAMMNAALRKHAGL